MDKKKEKYIRILIAEDHEIVRYGLKSILDQQHDLEVIGETSSCKETLTLTSTLNPDVILLDLTLTDGESVDFITKLKKQCPDCKILIYTASLNKEIHILALRYGAVGILLKSQKVELLCKAIRNVHLFNEIWIDKILIAELWKQNKQFTHALAIKDVSTPSSTTDKLKSPVSISSRNSLTPRESQIACLSSKGLTAKLIGEKLFISEKTVRNQLTIIYSKLNYKNQLELSINGNFVDMCKKNACQYRDNCPEKKG